MANLLLFHENLLHQKLLQTDLGALYQAIPFEALADTTPALKHSMSGKARKPWLDVKGAIGLMILKHYLCMSGELFIQRINTDWSMQLFCDIQLKAHERITDTNLPSSWRIYLAPHLDIYAMQKQRAAYWKPYMQQTNIGMQDATCYESRIGYLTDIKLLWQCCTHTYNIMQQLRRKNKLRKSRCGYHKQRKVFLHYQKSRKKTRKQEKKLRKRMLKFLLRLFGLLRELQQKHAITLPLIKERRLQTIVKVYEQQRQKAYGDQTQIKDRIVSLAKPYIRLIVRGKETKPVEFGAKVNKILIDGISFIEYLSFDAFHEGNRLQQGIHLQRKLIGNCTHHSADGIYATNANRTYCTSQHITTNFIPKGKQKPGHVTQAAIMRTALNKERATRMEGNFGSGKNLYLLQKVNARNEHTEKCWLFFGILTSNVSLLSQRMRVHQADNKARAA